MGDDPITQQVKWIKARGLGGNDQLIKMIEYTEKLEAALAEKDKELKAAKRLIQNMANDYHKLMAQAFLAKGE